MNSSTYTIYLVTIRSIFIALIGQALFKKLCQEYNGGKVGNPSPRSSPRLLG
jgi:hypothetical protein